MCCLTIRSSPRWDPRPLDQLEGEQGVNVRGAAYPPSDRLPAPQSITHPEPTGSPPTSGSSIGWVALQSMHIRDRLPGGALGCGSLKQLSDQLAAGISLSASRSCTIQP